MLLGARWLTSAASTSIRWRALSGALLAAIALGACGDDADRLRPDPSIAARKRGARPVVVTDENQIQAQNQVAKRQPRPVDPYANPQANAKPEEAAAEATVEEKPRDYPAELLAAMRGAESCVQARTASDALPAELQISLEALVLESGTVVSGSARAPVLTPEELECVKRRLESTRLPDKVKEAPRRVSASLKLTFKREGDAEKGGAAAPAPTAPAPKAPAAY